MSNTANEIVGRVFTTYNLPDPLLFKKKLLEFGERESHFCLLDNNKYQDASFECIAAIGAFRSIISLKNALEDIDDFISQVHDYIFCHISYDLKNRIENLSSSHYDGIGFPDFYFYQPQIIIILEHDKVKIGVLEGESPDFIFKAINSISLLSTFEEPVILKSRFSKDEYVAAFSSILAHISLGDCYEVCFCQEFFKENVEINPTVVFENLMSVSPTPYAAFYKFDKKYLFCASPERFLRKKGKRIFSQPIKGTARRHEQDNIADEKEKELLRNSLKERSENIMIVDLVRNDLSKISCEGTVKVSEYLEVYSYPQVHQLISTIEGRLRDDISFSKIIEATFPMGSMTGAPKKRSMEIIEDLEKTRRGLYSGTVGYISPEKDFDLNVVIRSLLYNAETKYLSAQAGSAITHLSSAENEYEECLMKMQAMQNAIN